MTFLPHSLLRALGVKKLMVRRKKWSFLWILIPIIVVGIFFLLSINYLIDPNLYRNIIQKSLTLHLGREVTIGQAKISLWGGIGITFEDFRVRDRSQGFDLLQSKRLILKARIFPLLQRKIKWKRVVLDGPVFRLHRDEKGRFNFIDAPLTKEGLKSSQQKMLQTLSTLFGGSLNLRDGELTFSDESLGGSPLVTEIRSFNLLLSEVAYRQPFAFHISGKIGHPKKEGHFSLSGTLQNISEEMDLSKGTVKGKAEIKGIDTAHFWPYLKTLLPMKRISGMLDLNGHYQRDFSGTFKISAKMKLREVIFDYPQVFAYVLTPKWVNLDLDVDYHLKEIKIPHILLELPEIWVQAKGKIYEIGSKEMGLEAEARSGPFDLAEAKRLIPYRIITPDVSDRLFRGEGRGPVQIISVKLSGKMPEIEHCDQLQHAHTLSVEMKLDKVRLKLPWDLPHLEDLKGNLLFEEGHLRLKEVDGKIFHSRIDRANGIFYRLLLVPTLRVSCEGRLDLMDLSSFAKIEGFSDDLSKVFSPISVLSGRAVYRLTARGDLKPPLRFQHQGSYSLSKVHFTHRQIPFPVSIGEGKIDLSNEDLQWSGVKVEFGDSSLLMNGSWNHSEASGPLEIMARGRMDLKNLFALSRGPLFPEEIRLKAKDVEDLSGIGSFSFKGRRLRGHRPFSYEGELMPKEADLLLKGVFSPLTIRDGTLSFSNLGVSFTKMKVQSGNSFLTLDGSVKEGNVRLSTNGSIDLSYLPSLLQSPFFPDQVRSSIDGIQELTGEAEVRMRWLGRTENWIASLEEGEIRLRRVFLRYRSIALPLSHIEGSLLLSPEQFRFEGKGKIGDSQLAASGGIPRSQSPLPGGGRWLSFQIFSPDLDLDLLFPKKKEDPPASFEKIRDWLSHWSIEGKVEADQVKYHSLLCQDLKTEMKTVDGKLFFHPFQFKGAGGDLWGEGWIEPTERGIRFEIKPRLSNMETEAFLRAFLQKGIEEKVAVTGRVYIDQAKLEGEGEDFQKMKESLNGSLRIEMENGVIERFNVLSKIFSVLNISQWFKGRFPDLTTKGLPYHQIIVNIHVKDGIASAEDLVIDSDAMKITLFGKFDVGKNLIDAKIGIHPLVTLDTVLSNVPIAGYIITGKDKAFLSFVYEVKGDLNNPKIEAIPIKGMGEDFLGIIKRLLETPLRPFRKTPSNK
jgi:hypothetical protein